MAKKKSKVAKYRKARAPKRNSVTTDVTEFATRAGAGFAGYTANRFISRAVYTTMLKKFPSMAKHLSVLSSFGGAFGAHIAGAKWDKIEDYKDEITLGAAIAAMQTAAQAYIPDSYKWIFSDHFDGKFQADKAIEKKENTNGLTVDALAGILPPFNDDSESQTQGSQRALPEPEPSFDLDAFMEANDLEAEVVAHTEAVAGHEDPADLEWNGQDDFSGFMN